MKGLGDRGVVTWFLATFLILLAFSPVVSYAFSSKEIASSFYNALKNNDYSVLEPLLSPVMKTAFNRNGFENLYQKLSEEYGVLLGYKIVGEEDRGNYHLVYVNLFYDKATITFRLVVNRSTGLIEGLWLQAVKRESSYALEAFSLPIIGGVIGFLAVYIALRRMDWSAVIFGVILLFITLFVQPPLQQAPFLLSGIRNNGQLLRMGGVWVVIASLWLGFVAGIVQELLKYYSSRNKSLPESAYIGAGFGLGEAIVLPLLGIITLRGGLPFVNITILYLGLVERLLALLFHASTTLAFSHYYKISRGRITLLTMILAHGIIDSLAAYYQLTRSMLSAVASYVIIALIAGLLLYKLLPKAMKESSVEHGPRW